MDSNEFILKLNSLLPDGFEAKKFKRMPRIHIKYFHYGFAVIDLNKSNYNLYALDGLFSAIGIRNISYEDTEVLIKIFKYIETHPSSVESIAVQSY